LVIAVLLFGFAVPAGAQEVTVLAELDKTISWIKTEIISQLEKEVGI
jgi:hypothetical protein